MMEQVRVGILGTSWWADAMYLPALKNHPKASIEAVAGRNPETTRAFASRWEIRKNYENAEELIEKAEIDALIVATGNDSHCPLTLKALERGLHVLCEKPLGLLQFIFLFRLIDHFLFLIVVLPILNNHR